MLGIGLYEILVIMLVACVLIRPQEVPSYITHVKKFYRYFLKLKWEIYDAVGHERYVEGDDGKLYKSYHQPKNSDDKNDEIKKINK